MMAKNRRNRQPQKPRPAASRVTKPPEASLAESATELQVESMVAAEELAVAPTDAITVTESTVADLDLAVSEARAAKVTFDSLRAELALQAATHTDSAREIEERLAALNREQAAFENERTKVLALGKTHAERSAELDVREEELNIQAAEAEAGFLSRRGEILRPVMEQIAELTAAWHTQERTLAAEWEDTLRRRSDELQRSWNEKWKEIAEERSRLDAEAAELARRASALSRRQVEIETASEILEEDRVALSDERASIVAEAIRESANRLQQSEDRVSRLLERIDEMENVNSASEALRAQLGTDPTKVLTELHELRITVQGLESELDGRPHPGIRDELEDARQRLADAIRDKDDAVRTQRELERQLSYQSTRIGEIEQLELTSSALEASIAAYRSEIEELTAQFNQLRVDTDRQTAFPECSAMDLELGGRSSEPGRQVDDLQALVDDLRVRMAQDREAMREGKRLNYRSEDLRIFLAGLAMSRLHLLEGVSGTGKTTLPQAFARAVGGGVKKIAVQAGWRDKQDLLGYYNSFERVYRETECLQALYKARLPYFADKLVFIVLDEMNLSHPEQYFADFLSALEEGKEEPPLSIVDRSLPEVPKLLSTDAGIQLPLAPNVWFIGTANQDETTFAFAPKTYDRSHVMELQPNAPPTPDRPLPAGAPHLSLTSLKGAFRVAEDRHAQDSATAQQYVQGMSDFFTQRFRVGWGNRLDLHISRFVPVDIAAGGSLGEALDHIVATKVLRKIQGRHSLRRESLEELVELIDRTWPDSTRKPTLTSATIAEEIRELDFG